MALDLSEHAEFKLKERRISILEVEEVLKDPENIYLDIETGNLVAVGKRKWAQAHNCIFIRRKN